MNFLKRNQSSFETLLTVTLVLFFLSACHNKKSETIPTGEYDAFFDSFTYTGNDNFYNENKLPDASHFFNPIIPGWYSDPSVCTNGKDYFLVTSTFSYFPGVPIFHSLDLVHWKQIGNVLNRESQLVKMEGQHTSGGIFAPDISYNPANKTYYMITTNVGVGNFFVKTQDPFGEWSDPIYLPDVHGIDPSFFFDDDGKAYIVNNDAPEDEPRYNGHRAIWGHHFNVETDKTFGETKVLIDGGVNPDENPIWIEGPHLYKIKGKYFLMAAEGGTGGNHSEVIFKSDSPMGTFKPWDKNPILTQRSLDSNRNNPVTCAGHADIIQSKEGDWWAVFLACRPIDGKFENLGRETFLMPVKWSEDGFPYMTKANDLVPIIEKRNRIKQSENVTYGNFTKKCNFDFTKLSYEWMTLRTSAKNLYSLTQNPGYLSLKCGIPATKMQTPSFICRRLQHHQFECSTKMYFNPQDSAKTAGLLIYKDENHQYFLAVQRNEGKKNILLKKIGENNTEILVKQNIKDKNIAINLKVKSTGKTFSFYFSTKDTDWKMLCENIDASYLSTAKAGGFTGTTIGLYAEQQ